MWAGICSLQNAWLTQDSIPGDRVDLIISLPNSFAWRSQFLGAFLLLTKESNWEEFGTLTPEQMSDEWLEVFLSFEEQSVPMIPVGFIGGWSTTVAPSGWLLCDGGAVSRVTYADLFSVIGDDFGVGDGTTTFNLPDRRGRVGVGHDTGQAEFFTIGMMDGENYHTLNGAETPTHTHVQNAHTHVQNAHTHVQNAHTHNYVYNAGGALTNHAMVFSSVGTITSGSIQSTTPTNQNTTPTNQDTTPTNQNFGGGSEHNNLQPYLVQNYIIKF